ncbi:MAG: circadian clock KaiB family protein [Synechococcales cyanobacterium C42_A2020_086]|jgi:circadian clock protein KaiB|nr:circadian clock KaiB family protein [Synechococcales cyanobacterium C42_A2020_086]
MGNGSDLSLSILPQPNPSQSSSLFKGIALFTPGGDLVYCIDPQKHNRWHLQLCVFLQELLGLSEPPHFLVPCYTATLDRWQDPRTQEVHTFAEVYPFVQRHQALLNVIFGCTQMRWQLTSQALDMCDPMMLASYRQQFPQLWQNHDLVARLEPIEPRWQWQSEKPIVPVWSARPAPSIQGHVLRLFVSGSTAATEQILKTLHQLLEEHLQQPYTLKVIDVRKHPEQAEADQITATPTLVKVWPRPVRRIAGDLDNPATLLQVIQ